MNENNLTLLIYGVTPMPKKSKTGLEICTKCAMWSYCASPSRVNDLSSKIYCLEERKIEYENCKNQRD